MERLRLPNQEPIDATAEAALTAAIAQTEAQDRRKNRFYWLGVAAGIGATVAILPGLTQATHSKPFPSEQEGQELCLDDTRFAGLTTVPTAPRLPQDGLEATVVPLTPYTAPSAPPSLIPIQLNDLPHTGLTPC